MSEEAALALLHLLAQDTAVSLPRAAKRLGLSASELQRLLVALGDQPRFGGLDLIEQHREGERVLLRLTSRGRALCTESRVCSAANDDNDEDDKDTSRGHAQ